MKVFAQRYHDFSFGHRVAGHENCCAYLHGHNLRVHFKCEALALDAVGRVIDFSVIKTLLCDWLERNWDHKFLLWDQDPMLTVFSILDESWDATEKAVATFGAELDKKAQATLEAGKILQQSIIKVPFNPTSEGIAAHLLNVVGPKQLAGTGVTLVSVQVDETRKCSAVAEL